METIVLNMNCTGSCAFRLLHKKEKNAIGPVPRVITKNSTLRAGLCLRGFWNVRNPACAYCLHINSFSKRMYIKGKKNIWVDPSC